MDLAVRGATRLCRLVVFNLWCSVCTTKIAAMAKTTLDEEAAMKAAAIIMAKKAAATTMCMQVHEDCGRFRLGGS